MKEILDAVNQLPKIRGSALLTADGVLVASQLPGVDGEALSALASQLIQQVMQQAEKVGLHTFRRLTLRAFFGTLYFARLDGVILVVVSETDEACEAVWPKIEEAISAMPRLGSMQSI